jgi:hypothetical protein
LKLETERRQDGRGIARPLTMREVEAKEVDRTFRRKLVDESSVLAARASRPR